MAPLGELPEQQAFCLEMGVHEAGDDKLVRGVELHRARVEGKEQPSVGREIGNAPIPYDDAQPPALRSRVAGQYAGIRDNCYAFHIVPSFRSSSTMPSFASPSRI